MDALNDLTDDDVSPEVEGTDRHLAAEVSGLSLPAGDVPSVLVDSGIGTEAKSLVALAVEKFAEKDYLAAADLLARAVELDPDSPAAHSNLGLAMWRANRPARAEALVRRAIALKADYVPAHRILSELMRERHDVEAARDSYQRLFALEPDNAIAYNNFGVLLRKARHFDEAQAIFARAHELKPDDPSIRFNQLSTMLDEADLTEALACCRRSLEQQPNSAEILTNLAVTLQLAGQIDEATEIMDRAVACEPEHVHAGFNRSLLLLLRGDYADGWQEYERRWSLPGVTKPKYRQPLWAGESLEGKTILLQSEQGFGDNIQCLRYVPLVAARSGGTVLRIDALMRLAASMPGRVIVSPPNARLPKFDVWCPTLSLPRILETRIDSIPAEVPYVTVRATLAERWRSRLAGLPGLRVALAWAGNPEHINDLRRSIRFERLKPLFDVPNVSFVSLQVGARAADLSAHRGNEILDVSSDLTDLAETAGAISNLDLTIAVDTAVAHVAGALGKPVWLMLPFSPDWRWLLDRDDSPWYPTMRLYRQRAPGDWDEVVARVAADLAARAAADVRTAPQRKA